MIIRPTYCAHFQAPCRSALRPVTISHRVNSACPPSSPGIGSRFITARMIDRKAVFSQKSCQSQLTRGRCCRWPRIRPAPRTFWFWAARSCFSCSSTHEIVSPALRKPAGIDSQKVYVLRAERVGIRDRHADPFPRRRRAVRANRSSVAVAAGRSAAPLSPAWSCR